MSALPKPSRDGGETGGPPLSRQRISQSPAPFRDHSIASRPLATDSAPYFSAFVYHSCRIRVSGVMHFAGMGRDPCEIFMPPFCS